MSDASVPRAFTPGAAADRRRGTQNIGGGPVITPNYLSIPGTSDRQAPNNP